MRQDLCNLGVDKDKLIILGHGNIAGVNLSKFRPPTSRSKAKSRVSFGLPDDGFVFCYVGRLAREKGVEMLIDTFIDLQSDSFLLLAGFLDDVDPISEECQRLISNHPRIQFLGKTSDVSKVFAASDVNILVSQREGFPNVVLESSAMGLPTIGTNVSGTREIVINGFTGWLIGIDDSDALLYSLRDAIASVENCRVLGANARNVVREKFNRTKYQKELLKYYKSF